MVCDCGLLLTVPPDSGGRTLVCRACGASRSVPDAAILGLRADPSAPAPAPAPGIGPAATPPPSFGFDSRLDIPSLERHAARLRVLGVLAGTAGVLAAAAVLALSSRTLPERVVVGSALLFAALLAAAGLGAARAAALAAVALAQRQVEMLRGRGA